ncbi:uncharacterized protein LTR77_003150 [Saxophila tyrrhenica]|uniref:Microtubule-associated protein Jupiter n=1 Tax=Saxophila tyrrhenica TaxID=1690608 RepID=A0AAV9PL50_9PEZI|nr:hypothetical protein LTR77_003150 [Saxophila tyrrhenica]
MPPKEPTVVADENDSSYVDGPANSGPRGKTSNPADNVGGTSKDGGLSTAATVADGGPDDKKDDPSYKPS